VFEKVYRRLTPAMQYTLRDVYSMYLIELSKQEGVDRLLQTVQEFEQSREGGKSSRRALGDASDKRDVIYTFLGQGLITISGDFPRALHYARLAVAADPSRPQNYLVLSMAYYANGDLQRGDQYYRAALRSYTSDKASLLAQTRQDYFKKICAFPQSGRNPICQTGR
jgi:tetratricopeptide (TPR) repeat protein